MKIAVLNRAASGPFGRLKNRMGGWWRALYSAAPGAGQYSARQPRGRHGNLPLPERLESRCLLTTYEVGPGLANTTLGSVPWDDLQAGDIVSIHYQPQPYHELILISGNGTAAAPIVIQGIAGPNGERPIIDGADAVLGPNLHYVYSGIPTRGLITISPDSSYTYGDKPSYIEISGLAIRNAHVGNSLIRPGGARSDYLTNAAGIYVERGENITIRDCEISNNSNGIFVGSGDEEALQSREILVQGNSIHDNGNVGSDRQHNVYTEAIGMIYEDNHFSPLLPGAGGNNIKDRSAGLVVRNNWIEGGAHLLDLVDPEGSSNQAVADPRFQQTFVYGNVLLDTAGPGNASNLIHYGGDSGDNSIYRKGTLYFYQNTVVIQGSRTGPDARWFTNLFHLDTNQQIADVRNNIFYAAGDPDSPGTEPTGFALLNDYGGTVHFETNWISPGWHTWRNDNAGAGASITGTGNFISNAENDPGFADLSTYDLRLLVTSPAVDQAGVLAAAAAGHEPDQQYLIHQGHTTRDVVGAALDLGAFEGPAPIGPGILQFQLTAQSVDEDAGVVHITVRRAGGTLGAVSVHFATLAGTAQAPSEFTAASGTLEFADGQSTSQIDVTILDNLFSGPNKAFQVQLSNATGGATLGSNKLLTVTIQNDEAQSVGTSTVGLSKSVYNATTPGQLTITINRGGDKSVAGQVQIATQAKSAKAGVHFTGLSQTVQFLPGQSSQQITIQLLNEPISKGKKVFRVLLTNATGGVILDRRAKLAKVILTGAN